MVKRKRKSGFNLTQQEFMISASLADKPMHGYAIARNISDSTDGQVKLSPGTLYGNINNMVDMGLIKLERKQEKSGRMQKVYGLTELGRENYFGQAKIFKSFIKEEEDKNGDK